MKVKYVGTLKSIKYLGIGEFFKDKEEDVTEAEWYKMKSNKDMKIIETPKIEVKIKKKITKKTIKGVINGNR